MGIPYHAGLDAYFLAAAHEEQRDNVRVFWFFGPAGVGKSYTANQLALQLAQEHDPDVGTYRSPFYLANSTLRWFDGYEGQRVVVFDEIRWQSLGDRGIPLLLCLLGNGPCRVEVKGGFRSFRGTWIFITSQDDPDVTFQHGADSTGNRAPLENIGQLIRRITKLVHWGGFSDPGSNTFIPTVRDVTEQYRRKYCQSGIFGKRQSVDYLTLAEMLDLKPTCYRGEGYEPLGEWSS